MISWFKEPVIQLGRWTARLHIYVIAIALVAASVPFVHIYIDDQLSPMAVSVHTLSVALSATTAILLFELILLGYLKINTSDCSLSSGIIWLLFLAIFSLSLIVLYITHGWSPITLEIWHKHIEPDFVDTPWKMVPIALLIGYILIQLLHRYRITQEMVSLKAFNGQLQGVKNSLPPLNNIAKESRHLDPPELTLPYKGGDLYLSPASIIRVESNENYCHILVASNEQQGGHCYMVRITLTRIINLLPKDLFLQVHRSHLINLSYFSRLERQGRNFQLQLKNSDRIPVSRSRIKLIRQKTLENANHYFGTTVMPEHSLEKAEEK